MLFRLGPLVVCVCVAIYRAVWLSIQLSGFNIAELGYLLLADLPVIGTLALLLFAEAAVSRSWWKAIPAVLSFVLLSFYVADVIAVLSLNARLQLADLRQFGTEWWLIRGFVSLSSVAALVVLIGSFFWKRMVRPETIRFLPASALVCLLAPFVVSRDSIPSHLQKYSGSVLLLVKELVGSRVETIGGYTAADVAVYRDDYNSLFDAPFARSGKDIVLVIVESLSAVDSRRTSGLRNILPRFDALSREGLLFRNFFANFEASEGGIVALVSGVPPVHFPTASTNTFGEYALQRSITETYKRAGYHCEFLTNVPLQFISMDTYARSTLVGFDVAAGQHEIARYKDAPRFAFQSPGDHVLYEELLAHLDSRKVNNRQPVLLVAVTASSHTPYVDPLGRADNEENVWGYVQDELTWLHDELTKRHFFDNGLLLITGDHRKMAPVHQEERDKFGESAKARIPLLVLGNGVPKDAIDDRLFQQADLLRMLDRITDRTSQLSPFALWVERYVFVFGVASNASNLEVFDSNEARQGFRLKLRGAEIDWIARPPNALAVERAIHRQRSLQQAGRAHRLAAAAITFGRELEPLDHTRGVLVGISTDTDISRDPDDGASSLKILKASSFTLDQVLASAGGSSERFTMTARAFLSVPADGEYWFSVFADDESCLAIDKRVVLGCQGGLNEGVAFLTAGTHRFDLRFVQRGDKQILDLKWLPPGAKQFSPFPQQELILPKTAN